MNKCMGVALLLMMTSSLHADWWDNGHIQRVLNITPYRIEIVNFQERTGKGRISIPPFYDKDVDPYAFYVPWCSTTDTDNLSAIEKMTGLKYGADEISNVLFASGKVKRFPAHLQLRFIDPKTGAEVAYVRICEQDKKFVARKIESSVGYVAVRAFSADFSRSIDDVKGKQFVLALGKNDRGIEVSFQHVER